MATPRIDVKLTLAGRFIEGKSAQRKGFAPLWSWLPPSRTLWRAAGRSRAPKTVRGRCTRPGGRWARSAPVSPEDARSVSGSGASARPTRGQTRGSGLRSPYSRYGPTLPRINTPFSVPLRSGVWAAASDSYSGRFSGCVWKFLFVEFFEWNRVFVVRVLVGCLWNGGVKRKWPPLT